MATKKIPSSGEKNKEAVFLAVKVMMDLSKGIEAESLPVLNTLDALKQGLVSRRAFKLLDEFEASNTSKARLLGISERTLARYRDKHEKRLSPFASERLMKMVSVSQRATEVFGNRQRALTWLTSPSITLGGRVPLDLMELDLGIDLVMKELGRIEHGVIS